MKLSKLSENVLQRLEIEDETPSVLAGNPRLFKPAGEAGSRVIPMKNKAEHGVSVKPLAEQRTRVAREKSA